MGIAAFLAGCLLLGRLVAEYVPPTGVQPKVIGGSRTDWHGAQPKVPAAASSAEHTGALPHKYNDEWTGVLATGTVIGALAAACVAFAVTATGIPGAQPSGYSPTSGAVFNITHNHFHNSEEAARVQRRVERAASQAMPMLATGGLLSAGLLAGPSTSKGRLTTRGQALVQGKSEGNLENKSLSPRWQLRDRGSVESSCELDIKSDQTSSSRTLSASKLEEQASQQSRRLSDLAKQLDLCDAQEESGAKLNSTRRGKQLRQLIESEKQRGPSNVHHAQESDEVAAEYNTRVTLGSSPSKMMQLGELCVEREHQEEFSNVHHALESEDVALAASKLEEQASQQSRRPSDLAEQVDLGDAQEESGAKQSSSRGGKQLQEIFERGKQVEPCKVHHAQESEDVAAESTTDATLGSSPSETMQLRGLFEREVHRESTTAPHVQDSKAVATESATGDTWRLKILKRSDERIPWLESSKILQIREERAALNAVPSETSKIRTVGAADDTTQSAGDLQHVQAATSKSSVLLKQTSKAAGAVERAQATRQLQATPEGMVSSGGACMLRHVRSMGTSQPLTTSMEQTTLDAWKKPSKMVSDDTVKLFQAVRASQRRTTLPAMKSGCNLSSSPSSPAFESRVIMTPRPAMGNRVVMTPPPAMRNMLACSTSPSSPAMGNRVVRTPRPAMRNGRARSSSPSSPAMANRVVMTPRPAMRNEYALSAAPSSPAMGKRDVMTPPPAMRNRDVVKPPIPN
eukprot:TRINITY_DN3687_c0_g3_i1.p1 TRINITY_DN3687_c0_g3~~TRINITY_DN3687_c0_g3_i1.p1  ORF type:complete len:767 (+),score=128.94 TRINITY_DN3687_c0_g3_i1:72-2303(+)